VAPVRHGLTFKFSDSHICEKGTKTILAAFQDAEASVAQQANVSSSAGPQVGTSQHNVDIPLAMVPMYHWMLAVPHNDERKMGEVVVNSGRNWVLVRPSFLVDGNGKGKGLSRVRVGTEVPKAGSQERKVGHAIGYGIQRADVGEWIAEECIKKCADNWWGNCASLTY
jgi:hypothetical protein